MNAFMKSFPKSVSESEGSEWKVSEKSTWAVGVCFIGRGQWGHYARERISYNGTHLQSPLSYEHLLLYGRCIQCFQATI